MLGDSYRRRFRTGLCSLLFVWGLWSVCWLDIVTSAPGLCLLEDDVEMGTAEGMCLFQTDVEMGTAEDMCLFQTDVEMGTAEGLCLFQTDVEMGTAEGLYVSTIRSRSLRRSAELRSCVKEKVAVLGSPSLIVPTVSVDVK